MVPPICRAFIFRGLEEPNQVRSGRRIKRETAVRRLDGSKQARGPVQR